MCGIFALLNNTSNNLTNIQNEFIKGKNRGPEYSKLNNYLKMIFGFHRLAINGLNDESNQPLIINDIVLICNGEIYNYKELYKMIDIEPKTGSDCEVIIYLYIKYGIKQTLEMLDGVYAFLLYDNRINDLLINNIYIARDPYGVRPLYYLKPKSFDKLYNLYGFASDLKCLEQLYNKNSLNYYISQFKPATYSIFELTNTVNSMWKVKKENICYHLPCFSHSMLYINDSLYMYKNISYHLNLAVKKRCLNTERPIACLLSGGLDSSLITALVKNFQLESMTTNNLETYSIGLTGSEDLKYARIVANYLKTKHTEIILTEQEIFDIIPEVIYAIESYDTTTVRASIGNYLLGKYIAANSDAKVIFNGDGSDELFGGYIYLNNCPDNIEYDKEIRRLLKDIHMFDVLRSDKSISSHGLEPRTPFLDKNLVNYILSISPCIRNNKKIEKYILRKSFKLDYFKTFTGIQILPNEILFRKKEAFSDGVSSYSRSLYTILQEQIAYNMNKLEETNTYKPNINTEQKYYKQIFDNYYPNCSNIIPYYWMPKYTNATDPSARTLSFYEKPSLKQQFNEHGDIRILIDLIEKYNYTNDEVSDVINIYEPDKDGKIPEVEHIRVLLSYFPKSNITEKTINAIQNSYPNELIYINKLRNK